MKYFYTADLHLGHANIISYANRPYRSIEGMNMALILRWNSRVKPEDTVFIVGDFCFRSKMGKGEGLPNHADYYIRQLNGRKNNSTKTIIESMQIKYGGKYINLVHDPKYANTLFKINFVGHVHSHWKFKRKSIYDNSNGYGKLIASTDMINVGVDVWGYFPVTYETIMKEYHKWIKGGRK